MEEGVDGQPLLGLWRLVGVEFGDASLALGEGGAVDDAGQEGGEIGMEAGRGGRGGGAARWRGGGGGGRVGVGASRARRMESKSRSGRRWQKARAWARRAAWEAKSEAVGQVTRRMEPLGRGSTRWGGVGRRGSRPIAATT